MISRVRKAFVRQWQQEYDKSQTSRELFVSVGHLEFCGVFSSGFMRSVRAKAIANDKLAQKAIIKIEEGITSGLYPEDAPSLCKYELGSIGDYVEDCYAACWEDMKNVQEVTNG
jgi:hypothetical protein